MFAIEVPLAPPGVRLAPKAAAGQSEDLAPRRGAILVVEDDPPLRESLELFLRAEGYETVAAVDGDDAIRLVERQGVRPDLIIVDYNLPRGLTGLQVMARLRGTLTAGVPALVLTGDISADTLRDIAAQGYDQRSKPVTTDDLGQLIRRLLSEGAGQPGPRASAAVLSARSRPGPVIHLVDDDPTVREAMLELLVADGRRVQAHASAEDFLKSHRPAEAALVLVDAVMPGMDGFQLLERLRADDGPVRAIMVTGSGDMHAAVKAMRAGAVDFLEKPVAEQALLASIGRALDEIEDAAKGPASRAAAAARLAGLTARQRQILDFVLAGRPSKLIAADLGISQRTVETHRSTIMRKTGSKSLSELVRLALTAV